MPSKVIILVPGGLGTTLSLGGMRVWDFDPSSFNFDGIRMLMNPALLDSWLPLSPGGLLSIYDDLITFFENNGYVKQTDLFLWGYDWRLGTEANAILLADFVNKLSLGGKQILFVSHSYGCMVVRWALLFGLPASPMMPMINAALVDRVVAAGPPMLGMASAFKDILLMPKLTDTFDKLFALVKTFFPSLASQLSVPITRSLMAVTAQLEGLPPSDFKILSGGSVLPSPYDVFKWKGWPLELGTLRAFVEGAHNKLKGTNWGSINCTVVASQSHATDTGYVLDANDEYQSDWPPEGGDGSVLFSSAVAYCPAGNLVTVPARHRDLLDDPAARAYLQTIL